MGSGPAGERAFGAMPDSDSDVTDKVERVLGLIAR